jgi:endonuclease/exonuclease/phosphatase family metal-dependent hydrolase
MTVMICKIISLNLWRGGLLFDAILEFLEREDPDVLMLQEVLHSDNPATPERFRSLETLQKHLKSLPHADFAPAFLDNEEGHKFQSGNAVLSRFPIIGSTTTPYDKPYGERIEHTAETFAATPRNLQHAVITVGDTELNIFNTQGVWDLVGERATDRRWAMCHAIAEATAGKQHAVLAGDMNLKPVNPTLAPIDAQLDSVFKHELTTSFNVRRKDLDKFPGYATAVVDLMYVSRDIRVLEHSCPDVDISDHLPLIVRLQTTSANL